MTLHGDFRTSGDDHPQILGAGHLPSVPILEHPTQESLNRLGSTYTWKSGALLSGERDLAAQRVGAKTAEGQIPADFWRLDPASLRTTDHVCLEDER